MRVVKEGNKYIFGHGDNTIVLEITERPVVKFLNHSDVEIGSKLYLEENPEVYQSLPVNDPNEPNIKHPVVELLGIHQELLKKAALLNHVDSDFISRQLLSRINDAIFLLGYGYSNPRKTRSHRIPFRNGEWKCEDREGWTYTLTREIENVSVDVVTRHKVVSPPTGEQYGEIIEESRTLHHPLRNHQPYPITPEGAFAVFSQDKDKERYGMARLY